MEVHLYNIRHTLPSTLLTARLIALLKCQVRDRPVSVNYQVSFVGAPSDRTYIPAFINLHGRNYARKRIKGQLYSSKALRASSKPRTFQNVFTRNNVFQHDRNSRFCRCIPEHRCFGHSSSRASYYLVRCVSQEYCICREDSNAFTQVRVDNGLFTMQVSYLTGIPPELHTQFTQTDQ
jgi:hypothetical protein